MEILAQQALAPWQGMVSGQGASPVSSDGGFQSLLDPPEEQPQAGDALVLDGAGSACAGDCQVNRGDLVQALIAAGYSRDDAEAALDLATTSEGGVDPQKLDHYLGLATRREAPSPPPPAWYAG